MSDPQNCQIVYGCDRVMYEDDTYDCATGEVVFSGGNSGDTALPACECSPTGLSYQVLYCDGCIDPPSYGCNDPSCDAQTTLDRSCDGTDVLNAVPIDEGCGDDEYTCSSADKDPNPIRYSSGRVETNPITLFEVATPGELFFGVRIVWGSHTARKAARRQSTDSAPTIHDVTEDVHFLGDGWQDELSDRLVISAPKMSSSLVTWRRSTGTVTFEDQGGGAWTSVGQTFDLQDRGSGQSPRWVVTTRDPSEPKKMWGFSEATYASYGPGSQSQPIRLGRLTRHALLPGPSAFVGYYGYDVTWTSDGRVSKVVDSMGRELRYVYTAITAGSTTYAYRLASVEFAPSASSSATSIAVFNYDGHFVLDRVERPGLAGYTRFLYWDDPTQGACVNCNGLLTDVIVAADVAATPDAGAPLQTGEYAVEQHDFEHYSELAANGQRPRAIQSCGAGRAFAYQYPVNASGDHDTIQLDLHQPGAACSSGTCATGYSCLPLGFYDGAVGAKDPCYEATENTCYVATVFEHDEFTRLPTTETPAGASTPKSEVGYSAEGAPNWAVDEAGIKTTYGYDTTGRLRCLVRNDDDDSAFTIPGDPTSACDPPPSGLFQVVSATYSGTTITKTTPSLIGAGNYTSVETLDSHGLVTSRAETGYTKNIASTTVSETHTTTMTRTVDPYYRVTKVDGPLNNATSYDVVDISYYSSAGSLDNGQVYQVSRHVGTSASHTTQTTTYSQYDLWGVPQQIVDPNGATTTVTPSTDRRTWTIVDPAGTTVVTLYQNGAVHSVKDADNVCLTYEYSATSGDAPVKMKRSGVADCGAPIAEATGEVEVRTYHLGEPERLASITRKMNGTTQFTYSIPASAYDTERRLTSLSTLDSTAPFTFSFTQGLPTATTAPGAPAAGTWKTETGADVLARPTHLWRWLNGSTKQTYTFSYASNYSPRPTQMVRGLNGTSASTTNFVYDDFGRLVQTVTPEHGTTRYEHDLAGNVIKERVRVGTTSVRTAQKTYDSLGRLVRVDHDTEHPVNCATAPTGTPIQDEEYRYDDCTGDVPAGFSCANSVGRLTISRVVLHCASAQTIKRGRWYSYDSAGRPTSVAYATVIGSSIGTPATRSIDYSSASRVIFEGSPLNTAFGTWTARDSESGRVNRVSSTVSSLIATDFSYRSFGPLSGFKTVVAIPIIGGGKRVPELANTHRSDDQLERLNWKAVPTSGASGTVHYLDQTFTYSPAGLPTARNDAAVISNSRYYGYDALLRLTCEARGDATTYPGSGDCSDTSARMAGLFTYHNGGSANQPQDVRATARIKNTVFGDPSATYSYATGSSKINGLTAGGNSLVIGYDTAGRRSFEYDSFDATRSRRDYTYLPNGQLGSISGRTPENVPYTVSVNYDAEGRPLTMVEGTTTTEFFYDDANRLIAVQRGLGSITHRWHFHYLGSQPLAATREIIDGASTLVKRFWWYFDERGLAYQLVDEQGVEYFRASYDASGWRTVHVLAADMWMPFGLPGQLTLAGTEAYASNGTTTHTRPALVMNQLRVYDPELGAYLQPDGADREGRLDPEGYFYARHSPVGFFDSTGAETEPWMLRPIDPGKLMVSFPGSNDGGCSGLRQLSILVAAARARMDIEKCHGGICSFPGGEMLKKAWLFALSTSQFRCPTYDERIPGHTVYPKGHEFSGLFWPKETTESDSPYVGAVTFGSITGPRTIYLPPASFLASAAEKVRRRIHPCIAQQIAHEALHPVIRAFPASQLLSPGPWFFVLGDDAGPDSVRNVLGNGDRDDGHSLIRPIIEECVKCN